MSPEPTADDLNDLFNYDIGLDEVVPDTTAANNASNPPAPGDSAGLGLDEEVKVTKKRQPVAKLDEARLLSQPGIPKLRRTAKQKLRFKGKGHEFSDAARLLNFYQLWLDDLFPKAKFADGLAMIEKLGHSKRIQTMRREWINEEKLKLFDPSDDAPQASIPIADQPANIAPADQNDALLPASTKRPTPREQESDGQDLFFSDNADAVPTVSHPEPEDDLDDILREQDEESPADAGGLSRAPGRSVDDFDAEYEAMEELGM
ncbi:hypothetical protein N7474_010551 [Penicillium riverlandense]|uniref:uncharacterized protein n=1 Tax=Penicillium riverlandense TaxID=1903569 RepID=UPI002546A4DD|nr:uncharacterized protein N7474_010551 [Penicillium riverlandense]KAJ5806959.1 hypothetical protein N7474_010551 [Penicillium riverlandense]